MMSDRSTQKLIDSIHHSLRQTKSARDQLRNERVRFLAGAGQPKDHFANYAAMIKNRTLDLFDDAASLIAANRVPSACVIARCVMETHAMAIYACEKVEKARTKGAAVVGDVILGFINSSRIKVEEQKRLKSGIFALVDYKFTEQAKARMESELASSEHVLNAMRCLFERQRDASKTPESEFELVYSALCEWTHPSQTSLFHAYAKEAQTIPTSAGPISLFDGALLNCARALELVQLAQPLYLHMIEIAGEI
jgi:hypothetical protein